MDRTNLLSANHIIFCSSDILLLMQRLPTLPILVKDTVREFKTCLSKLNYNNSTAMVAEAKAILDTYTGDEIYVAVNAVVERIALEPLLNSLLTSFCCALVEKSKVVSILSTGFNNKDGSGQIGLSSLKNEDLGSDDLFFLILIEMCQNLFENRYCDSGEETTWNVVTTTTAIAAANSTFPNKKQACRRRVLAVISLVGRLFLCNYIPETVIHLMTRKLLRVNGFNESLERISRSAMEDEIRYGARLDAF
ncbi:hypothetical protein ACOME3_008857 [Neoechinorhynchus agilis]